MAVKIYSCINNGLNTSIIEVEADIFQGMSSFTIVGLGDTAIQESKQRIRSAIKNSNFEYPRQKKIINLAPANLKKYGPHFDLPIAVSLLLAAKSLSENFSEIGQKAVFVGELALDGSVRAVDGILTMAVNIAEQGWRKIIVPMGNMEEAQLVKKIRPDLKIEIFTIAHLKDLKNENFFSTPVQPARQSPKKIKSPDLHVPQFQQIEGHQFAKRALTIAAAGGHHLLLIGSPGIGKTLLAKAFQSILPPLTSQETFEVMKIYSAAGLIKSGLISTQRPFRQVHPSCSLISLIGGGSKIQPGEISLSHHGVLFMDEIAEFPRGHLESLRQPLENNEITISRSSGSIIFPSKFILIASMNPCPCGYYGDKKKQCTCRPYQIIQYQKKISGPILDRIDMVIRIENQTLFQSSSTGSPEDYRFTIKKIESARKLQKNRFKNNAKLNSNMSLRELNQHCSIVNEQALFLQKAAEKYGLSSRSQHQLLKLARTIADLEGDNQISTKHLAEAMQYTPLKHQQSFN